METLVFDKAEARSRYAGYMNNAMENPLPNDLKHTFLRCQAVQIMSLDVRREEVRKCAECATKTRGRRLPTCQACGQATQADAAWLMFLCDLISCNAIALIVKFVPVRRYR